MRKRAFSTLLAFVLVLGLFPASAFAAGDHWAQQAVDTLNGIYGDGVFTIDGNAMTEGEAYSVLQSMGSASSEVTENSGTVLTREKACTILTEIFHIPTGSSTSAAIQYLYDQNIINGTGTASGLDETGTVTKAQFAVLAYRVLNFVGGGGTESADVLKPGTEEYFAWMYLAARSCVPFDVTAETLNTQIASATIKSYDASSQNPDKMEEKTGQDLWNAWVARLAELEDPITSTPAYVASDTLIAAAMKLVKATGATTILADVTPDNWYYDGVMYLFNEGIVQGTGNGKYDLGPLQRYAFAVLLDRIKPTDVVGDIDLGLPEGLTGPLANQDVQATLKKAVANGYMVPPDDTNTSAENWWMGNITLEEAVLALMKQQKQNVGELSESSVNTAVLERFGDKDNISEGAKPYMAYAVSHGLLGGSPDGKLLPPDNGGVTRPQIGVLVYRILISLDTTKMQDYRDSISFVLPAESTGQ